MKNKKVIKISVATIFYILMIAVANVVILQGNFGAQPQTSAGTADENVRPAAEFAAKLAAEEQAPPKKSSTLQIKNISVTTKDKAALYQTGKALHVECTVENAGKEKMKNIHLELRADAAQASAQVAAQDIKNLNAGEKTTLQGNFTPQNSGETSFECQAVSDKNSDHYATAIYVMP